MINAMLSSPPSTIKCATSKRVPGTPPLHLALRLLAVLTFVVEGLLNPGQETPAGPPRPLTIFFRSYLLFLGPEKAIM